MRDLCRLIGWMVVDLIRSRVMLQAEIWTLRQQINVLRRTAPKKRSFCAVDRMIFVGLYRLFWLEADNIGYPSRARIPGKPQTPQSGSAGAGG
jgi:hypothetical protein